MLSHPRTGEPGSVLVQVVAALSILDHHRRHAVPRRPLELGSVAGFPLFICAHFCVLSGTLPGDPDRETCPAEGVQDLPLGVCSRRAHG